MMNSWSQVIIEWANCLGVVESSVESIQDFEDGVFFETLVSQLCRGNEQSFNDVAIDLDFVSKYLQAEYPLVKGAENVENGREELYTATLLLVQCAQRPVFHRPMCVALKQETQVRIKRFLEVVLPCGKNLTRESMETAINGLGAEASPDEGRLTPRALPLREFLNSPAVKSARTQRFMNERNRELLRLRSQLETEQYEKADLMEDLKMESEKVTNLQKKLEERDKELRDLRIERSKLPTPQSRRKSKSDNSNEERLRRLAEQLEIRNSQLVLELERTRGEREQLARRLSANEKSGETMRDKLKQAEKSLENLGHELEARNNEIAYLRVNAEELREHIRQTKRLSFGEQSFDAESACDEALSSIVDLQLQEARKETCQLKKELAQVRLELENSVRECQKLAGLEIALCDATTQLDSLRKCVDRTEKQLSSSDTRLREKMQLLALNESDLRLARTKIDDLTDSVKTAQSETIELNSVVDGARQELEKTQSLVASRDEMLSETRNELREISICLENEQVCVKKLESIVKSCNEESASLRKDLSLSNERLLLVNEERKMLETTLRSTMEKLETSEISLEKEKARSADLERIVSTANRDIEALKNSLESRGESLNNEIRKVTDLESVVERRNKENEDLRSLLDGLEATLQTERAEANASREMFVGSKKSCQHLESLLKSKETLLERAKQRENSLNEELESCRAKIDELSDSLGTEVAKCRELETKLCRKNEEYAELEANFISRQSLLEKTESEKRRISMELMAANEAMKQIESNLVDARSEISSLEEQQKRNISANDGLQEYAKVAAEKMVDMESKIFNSEALIEQLDRSLGEKTEKVNELQNELNEKSTWLDSLERRLDESEKRETATANELRTIERRLEEKFNETRDKLHQEITVGESLRAKNNELEDDVAAKENQIKTLWSQWQDSKKELASRLNEISIFQQNIDTTVRELAQSRDNYRKQSQESERMRKELDASSAMNRELEEKLASKRKERETVLSDWDDCKKELASYVSKVSALELDIEKISSESQENCRKQSQEIEGMRKELEAARATNQELEEELAKSANESLTLKMEMEKIKDELEKYATEMDKRRIENAMLNEKELESIECIERLKLRLAEETERLKSVESEKKGLQKAVETWRRDEEKQGEERAKLEQRIDELSEESKRHLEEMDSLRIELENIKPEREGLREKIQETSNAVTVLQKRLVVAENLRMEAELEDKLKEEALNVVRAKLEQLGKEKMESELRMKEVIVNLDKVRTSQDQVMQAQIQALEEKSRSHESLERELAELRVLFEEKSKRLASEESKSGLVEKLESSLESERRRVSETEQSLESLRENMRQIGRLTQRLKLELSGLWDSVRETCPELARSKHVDDDDEEDAERLLATFVEDTKAVRKVVSILSEANETLKERASSEKETGEMRREEAKKDKLEMEERLKCAEKELETRQREISLLNKRNEELREFVQKVASEKNKVQDELVHLMNRWSLLNIEADDFVSSAIMDREELKNLVSQRNAIENSLIICNERQASNSKSLIRALDRMISAAAPVEEKLLPGAIVSEEIEWDEGMKRELASLAKKMNEFSESLKTYDTKLKRGLLKDAAESEKKLRAELERMSKEKKEIREKLDTARARSARMEKNMDELRNEGKRVKSDLREELDKLRASIEKLEQEKSDLSKRIEEKADVETLHKEYGQKLEKIKQKMKTAYNEQIAKLNEEQDKILKSKMESLKMQTEEQCRKYAEDIAKYKAHISDLSSRYWDVGEKLLAESQEKQVALQQVEKLKELRQQDRYANAEIREQVVHGRQKTASLDRREFTIDRLAREPAARTGYGAVEVIQEETTTFSTHRRHSVKSIQAMGNAFRAEDEEGEVFDSVYLADLKEGRCAPTGPDLDRLSELRMRNSMCRPHLKSSYAVETHLQPIALHEDDIKNGVTGDDVFNDSLSQSLLPGQKPKKKDRTQTLYKRPGPPTPSKNGGRLSLQGNELKSPNSRILKERNVERRTTATPRGLKNLFGTSMSRRQDENTLGTPKGRRLSNIFRKQRTERN